MTLSLIPLVRTSVTKELFLSLKSFNGVSREFKGCLKFKESFKDVSKDVSRKF